MSTAPTPESADEALLALASVSNRPVWLHLLVADRCNHACHHCYQVQGLKGELSSEQIRDLLREFRDGGGFIVTFSGGEATLREDLLELLGYAHELGLATVLYTNGFTMTEALASAVAARHVWRVEISLYSHRPEEHDAVTRVADSWTRTTQGIRALRARQVNVRIKFTPTAQSSATTADLTLLAHELGAHLSVGELVHAGEAGRLEPTSARRSPELALVAEPTGEMNPLNGKPCGAGSQLSVRSDGQVQPCSQLQVSMGQVGAPGSIFDTLAASEITRFFRDVTWADFPACRECDLRIHCRRCFASAATEAGNMLAPYRGACELAVARYRQVTANSSPIIVDEACGSDRDPRVGPYRCDTHGGLRTANEQHSAYDQALLDRNPWLRPSAEILELSACSVDVAQRQHGLIQLRRARRR